MRNPLLLALTGMLLCLVLGCASSSSVSKNTKAIEQQQKYLKELMDIADRNATKVKELGEEVSQGEQRLADLENRIATSQTDESATLQEVRENVNFLSDQVTRLDKSVQTKRPQVRPKGASVFKPGGFDVNTSYQTALSDYQAKRYETAISGFKEILTVSPGSSLADNAQYWIGECYDAMGNHEQALSAFNKIFDYPESNKRADAHVKIGLIYLKMGKTDAAREELQAVVANYPDTNAAKIAGSQLEKLGQ